MSINDKASIKNLYKSFINTKNIIKDVILFLPKTLLFPFYLMVLAINAAYNANCWKKNAAAGDEDYKDYKDKSFFETFEELWKDELDYVIQGKKEKTKKDNSHKKGKISEHDSSNLNNSDIPEGNLSNLHKQQASLSNKTVRCEYCEDKNTFTSSKGGR